MLNHINRLELIFTMLGIKFTRLKAEKSFEYLMFEHPVSRKDQALQQFTGYSWPDSRSRWCTAALKTQVIAQYVRALEKDFTVFELVGLAADEQQRIKKANKQNPNHRHPLADWGWTEADCLKYCYDHGFTWGGLYELFGRVSCWCCPFQSLPELRNLRKHFPELWERLKGMEHRTWRTFRADYSVDQLEIRFQFEEERLAQGKPINTREFYRELQKRIKECEQK